MNLSNTTQLILQNIPVFMRPTAEDGAKLRQHKAFFARYEVPAIKGFYDLIYSDAAAHAHITGMTREQRELILQEWYRVTMAAQFDEAYWSWQALMGIIRVKHNVPNSAVLSMWSWIMSFLQERLLAELPHAEAQEIIHILHKLHATVCGLIIESFIFTRQEAITRASGLNERILGRLVNIEIDELVKQGQSLVAEQTQLRMAAAA